MYQSYLKRKLQRKKKKKKETHRMNRGQRSFYMCMYSIYQSLLFYLINLHPSTVSSLCGRAEMAPGVAGLSPAKTRFSHNLNL